MSLEPGVDYQKRRKEHKTMADLVMLGTAHREAMEVMGLDNQPYRFTIRPVSDGERIVALQRSGQNLADFYADEALLAELSRTAEEQKTPTRQAEELTKADPKDIGRILTNIERYHLEIAGIGVLDDKDKSVGIEKLIKMPLARGEINKLGNKILTISSPPPENPTATVSTFRPK